MCHVYGVLDLWMVGLWQMFHSKTHNRVVTMFMRLSWHDKHVANIESYQSALKRTWFSLDTKGIRGIELIGWCGG